MSRGRPTKPLLCGLSGAIFGRRLRPHSPPAGAAVPLSQGYVREEECESSPAGAKFVFLSTDWIEPWRGLEGLRREILQWAGCTNVIDEQTQRGGDLPTAGIVDVKSAAHGRPIGEDNAQVATLQVGA